MSRQDQHLTTVTVNGQKLGTFDKVTGPEVDSSETKYKPGGMGDEIVLGGSKTVGNVVVSRLYVLDRDHELARSLVKLCGRASMSVSRQPLDPDGNPFGKPIVTTGKLKRLKFPDLDSEADGASLLELEMSTSGTVA